MSTFHLVSLLMLFVLAVQAGLVYQGLYKVTVGYKLSQGTILKNVSSKTMTSSYCVLLCNIGCGSATFSLKNKTCITFVEKFYNFNVVWTKDPDWIALYRNEPIQYRGWTLVFRAQSQINSNLSYVWKSTGRHDDNPLSSDTLNGCYRLDNMGGCRQHFRSSIMDNWRNITQVRFALYINGIERNYIVFDGTLSTNQDWFKQNRVLSSSWSTLKTDTNIKMFDIYGYPEKLFDINNNWSTCMGWAGYFTAVDHARDNCEAAWQFTIYSHPLFLFSAKNGMGIYSASAQEMKTISHLP